MLQLWLGIRSQAKLRNSVIMAHDDDKLPIKKVQRLRWWGNQVYHNLFLHKTIIKQHLIFLNTHMHINDGLITRPLHHP